MPWKYPVLNKNVPTSYWPLTVPGYLFLMDIPDAKHFLLLILSVTGVVVSRSKIALQQLSSITSLWSLRTTPQLQLTTYLSQLHAQCLTWTFRRKKYISCQSIFTSLMDWDVFSVALKIRKQRLYLRIIKMETREGNYHWKAIDVIWIWKDSRHEPHSRATFSSGGWFSKAPETFRARKAIFT